MDFAFLIVFQGEQHRHYQRVDENTSGQDIHLHSSVRHYEEIIWPREHARASIKFHESWMFWSFDILEGVTTSLLKSFTNKFLTLLQTSPGKCLAMSHLLILTRRMRFTMYRNWLRITWCTKWVSLNKMIKYFTYEHPWFYSILTSRDEKSLNGPKSIPFKPGTVQYLRSVGHKTPNSERQLVSRPQLHSRRQPIVVST